MKIFLAHASEDKKLVREIYSRLISSGFNPWLDEVDLLPGQNWRIEIPKAIRQSDIFIACLSQSSVQKQGYVHREFRLALNAYAEKPTDIIYLIPLKLDHCEIPDLQLPSLGISLRDIQWLDFWKDDGFVRLTNAIEATKKVTHSDSKLIIPTEEDYLNDSKNQRQSQNASQHEKIQQQIQALRVLIDDAISNPNLANVRERFLRCKKEIINFLSEKVNHQEALKIAMISPRGNTDKARLLNEAKQILDYLIELSQRFNENTK